MEREEEEKIYNNFFLLFSIENFHIYTTQLQPLVCVYIIKMAKQFVSFTIYIYILYLISLSRSLLLIKKVFLF